jgi:hypothetical protein
MTDQPELLPVSTDAVEWKNFERGRFGRRSRHLVESGSLGIG